jgi:arylsulfatase A-like enzyme
MSAKFTRREMAGALASAAAMPAAEPRPNIVVILSDDHSRSHLGCYGDPLIRTPNLDRFASEGMRFNRAFTTAPQCVPSRVSYMTGRSPVAARMGRFNSPLPPDVVTLPELLRQAGYFTGICGRNFHLDGPARPGPLMKPLFDKHKLTTFDKRVDYLDRNSGRQQIATRLNEFFDKRPPARPFFLWANFSDPHFPWDRKAIPNPHDPAKIPIPAHLPDLPGMRDDLARYYDEIARMDGDFEIVLDTVKARAGDSNTIVVFAGDNGHAFPHGKGSLYDPGFNVPFLVRWTGKIKAGSVSDNLISGEDLTPTMLTAASVPVPSFMSGRSFLGLLRGSQYEARKHVFGWRGQHGNTTYTADVKSSGFDLSRCVRSDRFKLIYNCTPFQRYGPVDSSNDAGWKETVAAHDAGKLAPELSRAYFTHPRPVFELYDLAEDPSELRNLSGRGEYAATEQELKEALFERMVLDYDFLPLPLRDV